MEPITALAATLTTALTPALPYLTQLGNEAAKKIGSELGRETFELAEKLWQCLHPKIEALPIAAEAVQEVAAAPDDADAQAALRLQLKKLLTQDPELAQALAKLLPTSAPVQYNQATAGDGGVALAGSNSGAITVSSSFGRKE